MVEEGCSSLLLLLVGSAAPAATPALVCARLWMALLRTRNTAKQCDLTGRSRTGNFQFQEVALSPSCSCPGRKGGAGVC